MSKKRYGWSFYSVVLKRKKLLVSFPLQEICCITHCQWQRCIPWRLRWICLVLESVWAHTHASFWIQTQKGDASSFDQLLVIAAQISTFLISENMISQNTLVFEIQIFLNLLLAAKKFIRRPWEEWHGPYPKDWRTTHPTTRLSFSAAQKSNETYKHESK